MPITDSGFMLRSLEFLATFFIFFVGLCALAIIVVYILDVTQTKHALRRNYPVVGHFRYFFEEMGKFFRQYFFAMDREEMPFNRAERSWVYRAAKDLDNTTAFGSTRNLTASGTVLFVNCPFPIPWAQMPQKSVKSLYGQPVTSPTSPIRCLISPA